MNLLNRQDLKDISWYLAYVKQILTICASLELVTFNHIPREWNTMADCLAKWASDHMKNWNIVDRVQLPLDLSHELDNLVEFDRVV